VKRAHKTNGFAADRTDPDWAERVEIEAERHTDQAEHRYKKAAARLERAELKLTEARARPDSSPRKRDRLTEIVEARRLELRNIHRQMRHSPAGSQNRGKGSYRGVPNSEVL